MPKFNTKHAMMESKEFYKQNGQTAGVVVIAMSSLISLTSLVYLIVMKYRTLKVFSTFNMLPFIISLLVSNLLKSIGIAIDFHWVDHGGVIPSKSCTGQAVILHLSNLGIGFWTPIIALVLVNTAFLRPRLTRITSYTVLFLGWLFIMLLVVLGPIAVQKKKRGPFFGIAGPWCGITDGYPLEHIFLEYFFLLLSAILCLAIVIALKVQKTKRSSLSHLVQNPQEMEDETMKRMLLIPIVYIITVSMFTICRMAEAAGANVPFGFVAFVTIVFNLSGLFNVITIIYIAQHHAQTPSSNYPWPSFLPSFKSKTKSASHAHMMEKLSLGSIGRNNGNAKATAGAKSTVNKTKSTSNTKSTSGTKSTPTHPVTLPVIVIETDNEDTGEKGTGNVFIAPDSWKSTAPKGRRY